MIEYGIALAVVCALSLFDKRSMPYSLTLLAGWLAGFGPHELWPVVSLLSGATLLAIVTATKSSQWWAWVIICCVPVMMLADAAYFWFASQDVYFPEEYANTLNALFSVQLMACAIPGGKKLAGIGSRLGRLFLDWCGSLGVGSGEAQSANRDAEARRFVGYRCVNDGQRGGVHLSEEA